MPKTYKTVHRILRDHVYIEPGVEFVPKDKKECERLLELGAIAEVKEVPKSGAKKKAEADE